ncbi:MAG: sulfatase-like hydrolase/transferase [Bacteroidota bacterium]|nr:sulfatase-like hydrolase/transferase [Bacteroidota bacterium]
MRCSSYYQLKNAVALFGLLLLGVSYPSAQRPNILYIMTDDMGYADLSGYGRKDYQTPNLDKLASQGIKFIQAYAAGSLCTPTRAAFMTGRYPARTPVGLKEPLTEKDSAFGLSTRYPSVASLLKESGYETILIGKWHLGYLPEYSPTHNGFASFFGFHGGAADYISHKGDGRKSDLYENEKPISQEGYLTDLFSQRAIAFIKQPHTRPFFLTLHYNAPHWPWQGPTDKSYADTTAFTQGGSPAVYAAMMTSLDNGVGGVMKALEETGLDKKTIVIFTNDNGGERFSDQGGLAQKKGTLWEGGIRVPAFVRWPGKIKAGIVSQQPIITMDWTATILAAANVKPHAKFPLDGMNLMPLCTGETRETERTFYWRTFQRTKQKALREGNWKYLKDDKEEYLFDLLADPGETTDLKARHADVFQRLKNKYGKWEKTVLQPLPL